MKVKIRVAHAITDTVTTDRYIDGHFKVLESYGVTKVTSADRSWVNNPHVYLIIVESIDGSKIYGGARMQLRTAEFPLPLEGAIYEKDKSIVQFMQKYKDLEAGEFCGLWNSREISGYGIGSIYLIRIGAAISSFLKLKGLMAFCSPYTVKNGQAVGLDIIKSLGDNGSFLYPKEGLVATIMEATDPEVLSQANELEKEYIYSLREQPKQIRQEVSEKGPLEIHFDLNIEVFSNESSIERK
ncbi:hypothetical protein [Pararhodonellum marinum]|uniref:hypothetical protein n=1 Tax=Pararhodonellum marinum TaxID=2755358 RepID=UPI00188ECADA|nr:hypothetical protein [Pararhodonellum marinum]